MPSTKKNNSKLTFKLKVRRLENCDQNDDVLDMFAGDGFIYRGCWNRTGRGATMDVEYLPAETAARERHGWSVVKVDAERALRSGIWRERVFSIVDIDCYGSPWRYLIALASATRTWPDQWVIVLTDGYMVHRNIAHEDKSLGWRKPGSTADYLTAVDKLVSTLFPRWNVVRKLYRDGNLVCHLMTLTRTAG